MITTHIQSTRNARQLAEEFCSTTPAYPVPLERYPRRSRKMGANAVAFIKALRLTKVDVLGFSIGGFIAQEIALQAPRSRQAPRIGRHRPARWGGHGHAHARGAGNLRYH